MVNGDRAEDRDRFSEGVTVKQRAVSCLTDGLPVMLVIASGQLIQLKSTDSVLFPLSYASPIFFKMAPQYSSLY